jgi:hypothetical protein
MIDEPIAKPGGDARLQRFQFGIVKFDHIASFNVDQMVVMFFLHGFVARTAALEIMAFDDAGFFEQFYGAIDGGDRNPRVDGGNAAVQCLDIWVIVDAAENAGDDAALLGDSQALFEAKCLDIDLHRHPHFSCRLQQD